VLKKIKAAVLVDTNQPLEICDLEVPPLVAGQVLVKILYSGVCGSQVMEAKGGRGKDHWLPHLLGHEGSGVVIEIGEGVTKVAPGDEVILSWIKGHGIDAPGAKYLKKNQVINSGPITTFSNYSVVSENRIIIKPHKLSFDEAILFGCAIPTGAGMALNEISPSIDDAIVILGLGGIGLSALMALNSLGIKKLIAIDISEKKLEMAKLLGATHVFNSKNKNLIELVKKATSEGADYCIESAGKVASIELGFSLINKNSGKLLFASHPANNENIKLNPHELISGKKIVGSWGGATNPDQDIPKFFDLFYTSKAPLSALLTKRYTLEQINEAIHDLESGNVFRPLIVMDH
jgi:S-(hydroxymethyl)glutathione dehydrogenase / alcohol dehydrogenase